MIKAFNTLYFQSLPEKGAPPVPPGRVASPVAGAPSDARAKVMRLVDELGFDPVDAGGLEKSWRQQPGTPVYTQDFDAQRTKEALAAAAPSRISEYRQAADSAARAFFEAQKQR